MELLGALYLTLLYFILLLIGVIIGKKFSKVFNNNKKKLSLSQSLLLYGIIISIGIKFGMNEMIVNNFMRIGYTSITLAISIIIFSAAGTYLYNLIRGNKNAN